MKRNRWIIAICLLQAALLVAQQSEKDRINLLLDGWHDAAARADFDAYFGKMTPTAVFIGTDATEHWDKEAFMDFSRPYFEEGKAWAFTPVQRHIFVEAGGRVAWFDELLDTWMQLCRGSGVLVREGEEWKIAHYVLSIAIPNETVQGVIALKKEQDSVLKRSLLLGVTN